MSYTEVSGANSGGWAGATDDRTEFPDDRTDFPDGRAARSNGPTEFLDGCAMRSDGRTELPDGRTELREGRTDFPDVRAVRSEDRTDLSDDRALRTEDRGKWLEPRAASPDDWDGRGDDRALRRFPPGAAAKPRSSKLRLPYLLFRRTGVKFRHAAPPREKWFSTLSRTARRALSAARRFFQQAAAGTTAAGMGAKQMAGRLAGVGNDVFQTLPGGETGAALPFADGGQGEAQFHGHLFERFLFLPSPVPEGGGEIPAEFTFEARPFAHPGGKHRPAPEESRNFDCGSGREPARTLR